MCHNQAEPNKSTETMAKIRCQNALVFNFTVFAILSGSTLKCSKGLILVFAVIRLYIGFRTCSVPDSGEHMLTPSIDMLIYTWWRHQMETFSALLAFCAGNSPVPGEFPPQRPVTRSFDVFLDLCLNKPLSKQSGRWWFETPSRLLRRHCNVRGYWMGHTWPPTKKHKIDDTETKMPFDKNFRHKQQRNLSFWLQNYVISVSEYTPNSSCN